MKVLVLGSSGQVGSYLVEHLNASGHTAIEFDIVNDPAQDLRISNNKLLDQAVRDADFVFFLAFDVGGSRYLSKYQHTTQFIANNTALMLNTFECLQRHGKPFVFSSSQMSNMSYSPYGVTKALGECYTKSLGGIVVKFWNVYGVEHDEEKSHVITDFIKMASRDGIIKMLTDGKESRDFLYAEDCCEALVAMMNKYDSVSRNEELCITSFRYSTIEEVAQIICSKMGCVYEPGEAKDSVQMDKKNQPSEYIREFWNPRTELSDGIGKIIEKMGV